VTGLNHINNAPHLNTWGHLVFYVDIRYFYGRYWVPWREKNVATYQRTVPFISLCLARKCTHNIKSFTRKLFCLAYFRIVLFVICRIGDTT
jgi:hypothetical protein